MDVGVHEEIGRRGVVTRRRCRELGMTGVQVDGLVRARRWVAVRRGVYTTAEVWDELDAWVGRPTLRARAASAAMLTPHVMSHDSAALLWGLEVWEAHEQPVHVTRPGVLGTRHQHGVKHHKAPYAARQALPHAGMTLLDRARTVADVARDRGRDAGLAVADSALRNGVSRAQLRAALEPMSCWPGVTVAREVVDLADAGAENAAESVARGIVVDLGLGRPDTQTGLSDGSRTVWVDIRLGRHVIELDGKIKYRSVADGGVATKPAEEVAWEEKVRRDFVQSFRLGVSRLYRADLAPERRRVVLARLRREVLETERLFGTGTADLAPYLVARRLPTAS